MAIEDQDTVTPEQLDQLSAAMSSFSRAFRGLSAAARQASLSLSSLRAAGVPQNNQDKDSVAASFLSCGDNQDKDKDKDSVSFFDGRRWTGQRPHRYVSQGHP